MYRYFLNKEWMISLGARRVYRSAAVYSLVFLALVIAMQFSDEVPEGVAVVLRFAFLAGVASTALTLVAMEYFLFSFDKSTDGKKALCFMLMMFPVVGAAVYCLTVYSRQTAPPQPETLAHSGSVS